MYRVLKEKGNNSNVILENTDTKAQVVIGRISTEILAIIEGSDIKFDESRADGAVSLREEWNLPIREETGKLLAAKAMRMNKPIRDQRKKPEDKPKKDRSQIDAIDVILGLASYK